MSYYSKKLFLSFYRTMTLIRLAEESLIEPILQGDVRCPCHLYSGEEAIATGICHALDKQDYVFGTHRSHGHYLAKGGNLKQMIAEIYGKETGCSRGRGGSMHLIEPEVGFMGAAPIVAGTISLAVGAALASTIRKENRVTVAFFGDGATGEGVLYESLNFASLRKLPIIFACENNLYSTHLPITEIRTNSNIYESAEPFGIDSYQIDGNDVLSVYEAALNSVKQCRKGNGPVFLELLTYRQRGHVGPDDNIQGSHTDIRPKKEVSEWLEKDPILNFEKYLDQQRIANDDELLIIRQECQHEVDQAYQFTHTSPYPKKDDLTKYVYRKSDGNEY